jgi:cyclic pyranopterin phosphate synthase
MPEAEYHQDYKFLKRSQRLNYDEILRVAASAISLGVTKIRLTGGEPLLDKNICNLIEKISALPGLDDLALTTNGIFLSSFAKKLAAAGMHRVTVSLDSIDEDIFRAMSGGRGDLKKVIDGIESAKKAGLGPIKINVVVQKSINDNAVFDLLDYFRGTGIIVRLIEFMDVGNRNGWKMNQVVPSHVMLEKIQNRWPLKPINQNYTGEVAQRYHYVDGGGEVGFISSVTKPFCGDCSRARLSADGMLYTCLFANQGINLREPLRNGINDDELRDILSTTWLQRADRYSELRKPEMAEHHILKKVEMYRMGG